MERDPFGSNDTPLCTQKGGASPRALIMSGYGINSEMETAEALKMAGMASDIVHINDLIAGVTALTHYRLLVFPGGFSYGDDTGAGNAFANRVRNNLKSALDEFLAGDNLVLGICNGFQILAHLGLVPGFDALHTRDIALMPNRKGVLECRFVTLKPESDTLWTRGLPLLFCPVAHGEGNFSCSDRTLRRIEKEGMVAFRYTREDGSPADGTYPWNPNGSVSDIAGITSEDGKVLGLMPHPERAIEFVNLYDWPLQKERLKRRGLPLPTGSANLEFFQNIVKYFTP